MYEKERNFDYSSFPESLRNERLFLLYETRPRAGGKLDKIPIQKDGRAASSTDPATWCTFQEAVDAYQSGVGDGVGLILVSPLCCVDLDHLREKETGELHPVAKEIVEAVPGWTEVSVSGTGVHIFGWCNTIVDHSKYKWNDDDGRD